MSSISTLVEAARLLGESPEDFRDIFKQGELKVEKVEGRWVFDDAPLPRSPAPPRRSAPGSRRPRSLRRR